MRDYKELYEQERNERRLHSMSSRVLWLEPDDYCLDCSGSGYQCYANTSTWRGGIGGQSFTNDVCSSCWGSGSKTKPWPPHKR